MARRNVMKRRSVMKIHMRRKVRWPGMPAGDRMMLAGAMVVLAGLQIPGVAAGQGPEPSAVAGFVVDYHPLGSEHSVQRAVTDAREVVALGTPLHAGDRVSVQERGGITLEFADGRRETLTGPGHFVVPDVRPLGMVGRIVAGLRAQWSRGPERGTTAATRGSGECTSLSAGEAPALTVPVLRPTTHLAAGTRDLTLGWLGGCPPYRARMDRGGELIFQSRELLRPVLRTEALDLTPGLYRLRIDGTRGTGAAFEVVVEEGLPSVPHELAEDETALTRVALATWLAQLGNGEWRWESFQILRPLIGEGYPMAGVLGDLLMFEDADLDEAPPG